MSTKEEISSRKSELKFNLDRVKEELKKKVQLIAVSKTKPMTDIALMYELSQKDFGENKVQELKEKANQLVSSCPEIRWHFIGGLQTNKINMLLQVPNLVSIHSIDSIKLLNKLLSKSLDSNIGLFLQVKTSDEDEKSGFEELAELEEAIKLIQKSDNYHFQGLMTMGKIRTENFEEDANKCFSRLVDIGTTLKSTLGLKNCEYSMGMSNDYKIAVSLGANYVRVGSKLFGERL